MKVLKKIIIALLFLAVLVVVVSLFMPSEVKVERTTIVNAPIEVLYAQANNLNNFHSWDPWGKIDSNAVFKIDDVYAGVGASMSWKSENSSVGNGTMTMTEAIPFEKINTALSFDGEPMGNSGFIFEEVEGGTKVNWWMSMDMGMNPIRRIMGNFMDAIVGPMLEKGLADLALQAESTDLVGDYTTSTAMKCITIRKTIAMGDMSTVHNDLYGKLMSFLKKNSIEVAGMPIAIYHSYNADMVDIEYGIPVFAEVMPTEDISVIDMPVKTVVRFIHMGDYANLPSTYKLAEAWMTENDINTNGAPWGIYVTDPETEIDMMKWKTEVYFPVN
jgi:effector-binding domain-containing protein/uncharacterized membrane protein